MLLILKSIDAQEDKSVVSTLPIVTCENAQLLIFKIVLLSLSTNGETFFSQVFLLQNVYLYPKSREISVNFSLCVL